MKSIEDPSLTISGVVQPRAVCSVFSAVLHTRGLKSSGYAVMGLTQDGDITYKVHVKNIEQKNVKSITFGSLQKKRSKHVEDLTDTFHEGWANGSISKTNARDIEMLVGGELHVMVETGEVADEVLEGRIAEETFAMPHLSGNLFYVNNEVDGAGGLVWLHLDEDCRMHFDIKTAGMSGKKLAILQERPAVSIFPGKNYTLKEFKGKHAEGHIKRLKKRSLGRLLDGQTYLQIQQPNDETSKMETIVNGVSKHTI